MAVLLLPTQLQEAEAHQALATLYTLERQYSQAMHHHLCALLKQGSEFYKATTTAKEGEERSAASTSAAASEGEERRISRGESLERQGKDKEGEASSQKQDKDPSSHPPKT